MIKTESAYKNKRTFSWINPNLEPRNTLEYGMGVYAKQQIPKGTILAVFGGHVLTRSEEESSDTEVYDNAIQIDNDFVIGAINKEELEDASYFNHSCDANAGINGQISLVSMREIATDEQVTFDYAMVLDKPDGVKSYKIKCLCGSINCRGFISDQDWKDINIQNKYSGFFSYYLQKKIDELKK